MTSKTAVAVLATAALLGFLVGEPKSAPTLESAKAPAFRLKDLKGNRLELDALLKNGPVLLDFWATWCKPCHAALPRLEALQKEYGPSGLTVVGISVDGPRNHAKVRPFVSRMKIGYPVAIDQDGRLQQLYQVVGLPTAILIDATGTVVAIRTGFQPGERWLEDKVAALVSGGAPDSTSAPAEVSKP